MYFIAAFYFRFIANETRPLIKRTFLSESLTQHVQVVIVKAESVVDDLCMLG